MKKVNLKLGSFVLGAIPVALLTMSLFGTSSCTKTTTVTKTVIDSIPYTPAPVPPSNPDNFVRASQVDSSNLVAYWSFNNTLTESVENLTGVGTNVGYVNGAKGQAYQGSGGTYATYASPGTALPALQSYSMSFWMNADQPIPNPTGFVIPGFGAQGMFDIVNSTGFWGNLHIDLEPYAQFGTQDSANSYVGNPNTDTILMKIEMTNTATGVVWSNQFPTIKLPHSVDRWTHVVITYNGASGLFSVYENGSVVSFTGAYGGAYGPFNAPFTLYASDPGSATNSNNAPVYGNLQFANATALVIGGWQLSTTPSLTSGAGNQPWASNYTGALDEFKIFKDVLTAKEVNELYILEQAGF